jgi:hypothetical protein
VVFGGVVFIYHVVVDESQWCGAAGYRRRARIVGRGQDGGAVWCYGDIDSRPGTVNALILLGDGFEIDGGCILCDVCNGTTSGFCFLDDVSWCTVSDYGLFHGPPSS